MSKSLNKSFFDTSIFIYALENDSEIARDLFQQAITVGTVGTSTITLMEYATGCFKHNRLDILNNFQRFLNALMVEVVPVNGVIAFKAAEIRSKYSSFKQMDALQIATAVVSGANVFYTNDKQLLQFQEIAVIRPLN